MVIQQLLVDAGAAAIDQDLVMVEPRGLEVAADWRTLQSPETYVGYGQRRGFAQEAVARFDEPRIHASPGRLTLNTWGLSGTWTVARNAAVSNEAGARISFRFHARDLILVMGPRQGERPSPFGSSSMVSRRAATTGPTSMPLVAGSPATSAPTS